MDTSRSIRSSSLVPTNRARAGNGERGFVLVSALLIAVLYLGLIELMLADGSRAFHEAQRLRSRILAATLAENAAELAAEQMVHRAGTKVTHSDAQGRIDGTYVRGADQYEITGTATTAGVAPEHATVRLQGRIIDEGGALPRVTIDYAIHSQ